MGLVNKFTVINKKPKATDKAVTTKRTKRVGEASYKKSNVDLRTYNKEKKSFDRESKTRDVIAQAPNTVREENVEGATFKWEMTFNGQAEVVKEVITQKELQELFVLTNASEDATIRAFEDNIAILADPYSANTSVSVELPANTIHTLYTEPNNNSIFNEHVLAGPGATLTTQAIGNINISVLNPASPAGQGSTSDGEGCN